MVVLAQLAEHRFVEPKVTGSSPVGHPNRAVYYRNNMPRPPASDRDAYNAYMREYKRKQYVRLKGRAISLLGGKCVRCGTTSNLQIDHIDPRTKSFEVNHVQSHSWTAVAEELGKCQLLCVPHHKMKTLSERGQSPATGVHGTVSGYRYCGPPKCGACKEAKRNVPSYKSRRLSSVAEQSPRKR